MSLFPPKMCHLLIHLQPFTESEKVPCPARGRWCCRTPRGDVSPAGAVPWVWAEPRGLCRAGQGTCSHISTSCFWHLAQKRLWRAGAEPVGRVPSREFPPHAFHHQMMQAKWVTGWQGFSQMFGGSKGVWSSELLFICVHNTAEIPLFITRSPRWGWHCSSPWHSWTHASQDTRDFGKIFLLEAKL